MYSILSPEGFAAILYKDASRAPEVVEQMKITSDVLFEMGIVDYVIGEGENGIVEDFSLICEEISRKLAREFSRYRKMKGSAIQKERYNRFREFGDVEG